MVRTKEGGGSGEKQERGEGEVSREGGGMYWLGSETVRIGVAPSSPFVVVGVGVALSSSSIFVLH